MVSEAAYDLARPVATDHRPRARIAYEASKHGRIVVRLSGFESDDPGMRVAAEIHAVRKRKNSEPQWQFRAFPTSHQAQRFIDEALIALEFLGCTITEVATE